jgi:hypothetical protein
MTLNTLNEKAQEKFDKLKSRMKLDISAKLEANRRIMQEAVRLPEEDFREISEDPRVIEVENELKKEVDLAFNYIDSLKLPPQLSLAVGYIVAFSRSNKTIELEIAIETLREFLRKG